MPDEISTFELPADQVHQLARFGASRMATDGAEAARASALGLVEVVDDRVREVAVSGTRRVRLERHGDRLFVFAATLLGLAGAKLDGVAIDGLVDALRGQDLPLEAFHRANAVFGRGRPPIGSWWVDVAHASAFLELSECAAATDDVVAFLHEVEGRVLPGLRRDLCGILPQTGPDGEVVLGIVIKGKLMPILVDDVSGLPILSQVQIGSFENSQKRTVAKAAERLGLVLGSPGVSKRRSIALDGKSYVQIHYDMDSCLRLAVELRSYKMVSALTSLNSLVEGSGVGQARLEVLKVLPAVQRVVDLNGEG